MGKLRPPDRRLLTTGSLSVVAELCLLRERGFFACLERLIKPPVVRPFCVRRLLCACAFLIFTFQGHGQSTLDLVESEPTGLDLLEKVGSERNLTPLEKLLLKHFRSSIALECQSLLATGSFKTQGKTLPLTIVSKRPSFFRQSINHNKTRIEAGHDGAEYWYSGPVFSDSELAAINRAIFFLQADLGGLMWIYEREGVHSMSILKTRIFDGVACRVVSVSDMPAGQMLYLIEGSNGRERGRVMNLSVGDQKHRLKLIYKYEGAPTSAGDLQGYQLWVNGEIYADATFSSIRRNLGIMPWSFQAQQ